MFPDPRDRDTSDAAPIPTESASAKKAICTGNVTVTPAIPSSPIARPIKIVSTMLYSEITSIPTMAGADIRSSNLLMLCFPKKAVFSFMDGV